MLKIRSLFFSILLSILSNQSFADVVVTSPHNGDKIETLRIGFDDQGHKHVLQKRTSGSTCTFAYIQYHPLVPIVRPVNTPSSQWTCSNENQSNDFRDQGFMVLKNNRTYLAVSYLKDGRRHNYYSVWKQGLYGGLIAEYTLSSTPDWIYRVQDIAVGGQGLFFVQFNRYNNADQGYRTSFNAYRVPRIATPANPQVMRLAWWRRFFTSGQNAVPGGRIFVNKKKLFVTAKIAGRDAIAMFNQKNGETVIGTTYLDTSLENSSSIRDAWVVDRRELFRNFPRLVGDTLQNCFQKINVVNNNGVLAFDRTDASGNPVINVQCMSIANDPAVSTQRFHLEMGEDGTLYSAYRHALKINGSFTQKGGFLRLTQVPRDLNSSDFSTINLTELSYDPDDLAQTTDLETYDLKVGPDGFIHIVGRFKANHLMGEGCHNQSSNPDSDPRPNSCGYHLTLDPRIGEF